MIITQANRDKLSPCCQMRFDFFIKMEENKNEQGNIPMKAIEGDIYSQFQAFIVGSCLLDNMNKKTCLDCLNFRHLGLNYYCQYKRKTDAEKWKEAIAKQK